MTTEPHIKRKNLLAGLYGASSSSLMFLLILVFLAFWPTVPGDDTSIRSAAILLGAIPVIWVVLFVYFLGISFKAFNRLKFALIFQSVWVMLLSGLLASVALSHEGMSAALPVFAICFLLLTVIVGVGSWCSTLAK